MDAIITNKIDKYIGNSAMSMWFANTPNNGGIRQNPKYAQAIWIPIIACDFSLPNNSGVI